MGIFDLIGKAYSGLVTGVAGVITAGIEKVTGETYGRMTAVEFREEPTGKVLTTAFTGTLTALGVATLPVTAPLVLKGVIAKPVVALVGAGLLVTKGGRTLITKGVEGVYLGGKALGEAYEVAEEKGEEITISEALKTAGLVGAGLVVGAGAPAIIEKGKEIFTDITGKELKEVVPKEQLIPEKAVGDAGIPVTPATTTITTGKKPYKRRRAKITPPVKQYVRVDIINQPRNLQSIKYINSNPLSI